MAYNINTIDEQEKIRIALRGQILLFCCNSWTTIQLMSGLTTVWQLLFKCWQSDKNLFSFILLRKVWASIASQPWTYKLRPVIPVPPLFPDDMTILYNMSYFNDFSVRAVLWSWMCDGIQTCMLYCSILTCLQGCGLLTSVSSSSYLNYIISKLLIPLPTQTDPSSGATYLVMAFPRPQSCGCICQSGQGQNQSETVP